jgi:metal-sulfur cluster biosynthetic enzyme
VTWRREPINDDQVLDALKGVCDPELGISIVDLGLVLRATRRPALRPAQMNR